MSGIAGGNARRPRHAASVKDLASCEKWRGQIVREISRKMTRIHDPSLSDYQIRDTNDDINRLMKEKLHWEIQIRKLGGPNYMRGGAQFDSEGREVPGSRGYKYFGRARELPGVKELFEQVKPQPVGKRRAEINIHVDAAYYGYLDDEDGTLLEYEKGQEEILFAKLLSKKRGDAPSGWAPIPEIHDIPTQTDVLGFLEKKSNEKDSDND